MMTVPSHHIVLLVLVLSHIGEPRRRLFIAPIKVEVLWLAVIAAIGASDHLPVFAIA